MTKTITQTDHAAALLFQFAGVCHASTRLCEGVINLAADMFKVYAVEDLDEDQIYELLDALQEVSDYGDDY